MHAIELTAETLNLHCGRSLTGEAISTVWSSERPSPVDILAIQELWQRAGGIGRIVAQAESHGYTVFETPLLRHTTLRDLDISGTQEVGTLSIALLTRHRVLDRYVINLGTAPGDVAPRKAQVAIIELCGVGTVRIVNTHLTHKILWSPFQLRKLTNQLSRASTAATLLMGDLNTVRPLTHLVRGFRSTARAATWPAASPRVQLDYILASQGIRFITGGVSPDVGSDHLPLWGRFLLESSEAPQ
jgi:endonuclease/exonuclease/phosphatase family metal-dependent hydrolase